MACYRESFAADENCFHCGVNHRRNTLRSKQRGLAFVNLYAAAKQLADNYPKRFSYLEYQVRLIENEGLAPKLEERKIR